MSINVNSLTDRRGPLIAMHRGDDRTFYMRFRTQSGTPIDITGMTVYWTAKTAADDDATDASAVVKKTITDPDFVTIDAELMAPLIFEPVDTKSVAVADYEYDVQVKDTGGKIVTAFLGTYRLKREITNRA